MKNKLLRKIFAAVTLFLPLWFLTTRPAFADVCGPANLDISLQSSNNGGASYSSSTSTTTGQQVTFSITVSNNTGSAADNILVKINYPTNSLSPITATVSQNGSFACSGSTVVNVTDITGQFSRVNGSTLLWNGSNWTTSQTPGAYDAITTTGVNFGSLANGSKFDIVTKADVQTYVAPTPTPPTVQSSSSTSPTATPTPTPTNSGSCTSTTPGGSTLSSASRISSSTVRLSWTTATNVSGYSIRYGTSSGSYSYGASVGNVTSTDVGSLGSSTYYFSVLPTNGCASGSWSNEIASSGSGSLGGGQVFGASTPITPVPTQEVLSASSSAEGEVQVVAPKDQNNGTQSGTQPNIVSNLKDPKALAAAGLLSVLVIASVAARVYIMHKKKVKTDTARYFFKDGEDK
ncbi:MAG: hypothetical protein HY376_00205 [Candidatus Blackburnbacteria bacterium]|nr:hypothetical protein [Candidatus Blackburnbacteria bacterium]